MTPRAQKAKASMRVRVVHTSHWVTLSRISVQGLRDHVMIDYEYVIWIDSSLGE